MVAVPVLQFIFNKKERIMNLAVFAANGDFSQRMLEQSREPERGSIRATSMFEPVLARERRRASCAGAETAKELWRPRRGKIDLSEKIDRFIN